MAREINFAEWPIIRSTSLGVTIAQRAEGSISSLGFWENSAVKVAPSMTVGTPIEMTGIPIVFSLISFRLFWTPEPGEMPLSEIWMVFPRWD